jgi:D-xylose transport system permease protein
MTSMEKKSPDADAPASAAEQAGPASPRSADFGIDTTAKSTGEAIRAYATKLRGGDLGALPALLGLLALFILFTALASETFPSLLNLANLLQQGAGQTIIAMGLVFVLLTGEIDLAAGTASGLTAALMALHLVSNGNLLGAMGTTVFLLTALGLAVTVVLGALLRIWSGTVLAAVALLLLVIGFPPNPWLEMLLAVCTGVAIGIFTGFLVSRVGMPSFVVTLALFIAWQGVILQLIGEGGTLGLRDPVINGVANANLSTLGSWILFVVAAGGYAAVLLNRQFSRRRLGLVAQPTGLVLIKIAAVVVLSAIATFLLTINRSLGALPIAGVPYVVPIVLVLLVAGTFVLDRTQFGRHIYAVGGNLQAAALSGVKVKSITFWIFVNMGLLAGIAGVIFAGRLNQAGPTAGMNFELDAIAAAFIGGAAVQGGVGKVVGAITGGLIMAVINNGMSLIGAPSERVMLVKGLVLLAAVAYDVWTKRRAAGR